MYLPFKEKRLQFVLFTKNLLLLIYYNLSAGMIFMYIELF